MTPLLFYIIFTILAVIFQFLGVFLPYWTIAKGYIGYSTELTTTHYAIIYKCIEWECGIYNPDQYDLETIFWKCKYLRTFYPLQQKPYLWSKQNVLKW